MTIDRRLRSGDAPSGALLAIWLLTSLCITFAAMAWPASTGGLAERIVPLVNGCAALAVTMMAVGRTAWRLLGREACIAACLLLPLSPLVLAVFLPQGNHHAAWQLAATGCAIWSMSHRDAVVGAVLAGCAMAAGCALEPVLWPIAAAVGAVLFARWLRDPLAGTEFIGFLKALVAVSIAALAAAELFGGNEACASARLAPFGALAILLGGATGLARIPRLAPAILSGGMVGVIAASLGAATLLSGCSGSSVAASALPSIQVPEGGMLAAGLVPALLALGSSLYLWRSNEAWLRRWWRDYTWILALAAVGGVVMPNLLLVTAMLAAMPLGWLAAQLLFGRRRGKGRMWRPASLAVIALAASVLASAAQSAPEQALANVAGDPAMTLPG